MHNCPTCGKALFHFADRVKCYNRYCKDYLNSWKKVEQQCSPI